MREIPEEGYWWIREKDLRAEAIRWVKEMRKDDRYWSTHDEDIIHWITHFFNLTEEDLKERDSEAPR